MRHSELLNAKDLIPDCTGIGGGSNVEKQSEWTDGVRALCLMGLDSSSIGRMVQKLHLREKVRVQGVIGEWFLLWPMGGHWTLFVEIRSGSYGCISSLVIRPVKREQPDGGRVR